MWWCVWWCDKGRRSDRIVILALSNVVNATLDKSLLDKSLLDKSLLARANMTLTRFCNAFFLIMQGRRRAWLAYSVFFLLYVYTVRYVQATPT